MIHPKPIFVKSNNNLFGYGAGNRGLFFTFNIDNGQCSHAAGCREAFDGSFNKNTRYIGFYVKNLNIVKLSEFFDIIEKNLGINQIDKTILFRTNLERPVVILRVSPFWLSSRTYRGILTMLLRCGAVYYNTTLEKALIDYNLTNGIRDVICHFLNGNTKFKFKKLGGGVFEHFRGMDSRKLAEQMVNPHADKLKTKLIKNLWE